MKRNRLTDIILIDLCGMILLAECLHTAVLLKGVSFSYCADLFAVGLAVIAAVNVLFLALRVYRTRKDSDGKLTKLSKKDEAGRLLEAGLYLCFFGLLASQVLFLLFGGHVYRQGDMMAETVESFLVTDAVYQVNPMTGAPYEAGMPLRLQILGLPSLYGFLCIMTDVSSLDMVQGIVPIATLICSYLAFGLLGKTLFPENRRKQVCFLIVVALLLWVGAYHTGMDGFQLLYCGWTGVSIRNLILLPWLFSLMMRRKWLLSLAVVVVEACLTWTLYGLGISALIVVLMLGVDLYSAWKERKVLAEAERRKQNDGTP